MRRQTTETPSLTETQRRAWKAVFIVNQLVLEQLEAEMTRAGLGTMSEFDVLYTLYYAPERKLTIREIAASMALSHSGLSRLIDRLEERGYVSRCAFAQDRRAVAVQLLAAGDRRIDEVWAVMAAAIQTCFASSLTDAEHAELLRLMSKALPPLADAKEERTGLPFLHRV